MSFPLAEADGLRREEAKTIPFIFKLL